MRIALDLLNQLIGRFFSMDEGMLEFFESYLTDISREITRNFDDARNLIVASIQRSLRWWREVGHDRHYSQRCTLQVERALEAAQGNMEDGDALLVEVFNDLVRLLDAIGQLPQDEKEFFSSYLQELSHEIRHFHHENIDEWLNLAVLWDEFGSNSFPNFARDLLSWVLDSDEFQTVSNVSGIFYGTLPETEEIKKILLQGIWDKQKSNRLRERFFWCFNYQFKKESINFFSSNLERFIQENGENEKLMSDIIDLIHWNMQNNERIAEIKLIVKAYLVSHPNVEKRIHSPATKEIFGIA